MIKTIVFSGGGFKCWAYIGTIRALQEYKINAEQIIGVSAGAIFGLFYLLGIKWETLLDFFMDLNFKEVMDIDIDNVLTQQSLLAGIRFTEIIKEIIGHVIDPNLTFKELYIHSKIKFTVNALNITDNVLEYFNYSLTPNIKIIDAIRASCNLPIIFPAYPIGNTYYYDGGLCNNCPFDTVDELESIAFNLDFTLVPENEPLSKNNKGVNFSTLKLLDLLNCLSIIANKSTSIKSDNIKLYNILDAKFKDHLFNLNQKRDDIFNIYMNGYINSKNIIFKNHIALPAP